LLIIYGEEKMKIILVFLAVASCTAYAQITITSTDVANMFAVGNGTTVHQDTSQSMIDIGTPGGGNNWNFTTLQSNLTADMESIDPNSSPYISDFAGADVCVYTTDFSQGEQAEIWTYSKLNGTFDAMGSSATVASIPGFVTSIKNDPYRRTYETPMTINSQWSQSFTQIILINGTPFDSTSIFTSYRIDAYGTMTVPGGVSYDALRIRETLDVSGFPTIVTYSFLALNGLVVAVFAKDPVPPNSGLIVADGTSYGGALTTTGVEQTSKLPNDYSISQNYPNPFNPSTNIEYSIPSGSFVQLKVYDILGNKVATLVNEEQSAGIYRADFSGINLASGLYIARITSGNFSNSIKMTLMK
jgi:hypothetical protein